MLESIASRVTVLQPLRQVETLLHALLAHFDLPVAVELWNGRRIAPVQSPRVILRLRRRRALRVLTSPSLDRFATAYVEGDVDIDGNALEAMEVAARLCETSLPAKRRHTRRSRHTREADRDDIAHHYDVSNDFYRAWLDAGMVYSCAYFGDGRESLEAAQLRKIDHILTKIRLAPGERLLDIGCGWGSLAIRAARDYDAQVLGITLSKRQYELARQRIAEAGVADRCEVKMLDYRDLDGRFDKITSVGMFEHVGLKNLRAYFTRIHDLLEPHGVALNHGITSTDPDSRETPFGGGRFIDRYVFPNGELPHIGLVLEVASAAGLEALDVENLRRHYALTVRHWLQRFEAAGARLIDMVGERHHRIWRAYLAGCAFGFSHNWIALHQVLVCKAGDADSIPLPLTRDYMYPPR